MSCGFIKLRLVKILCLTANMISCKENLVPESSLTALAPESSLIALAPESSLKSSLIY